MNVAALRRRFAALSTQTANPQPPADEPSPEEIITNAIDQVLRLSA